MSRIIQPPSAFSRIGDERRATEDELVGERTIGGPLAARDVRLYLDAATLRHLLEVAESSGVNRVQIDGVGVRVRSWRDPRGHVFETWQILGQAPKPETHALFPGDSQ